MLFYNAVECHFEGLSLGKSFGMITKMLFSSLKKYCWLEIVTRNLAFMKGVFAINSGTRKKNFFPTFTTCEKKYFIPLNRSSLDENRNFLQMFSFDV